MNVSLVMSMITRKGTIVRKTRISRAHPSARRQVTGSLRGGHFGITTTRGKTSSGASIHQTATSSTVPSLLTGARSNPQNQYGRQSIGSSSQHHPCICSSNSDQQHTSSSRPSLFNTLVQLKVEFVIYDYGCNCFILLLETVN